jgi:hypothetical protein
LASSKDFFLRRFSTNLFLEGKVVSLTPNPQPEGPVSVLIPPETGLPSCTPGHWTAWVPWDQYPLTSDPEGNKCYYDGQINMINEYKILIEEL